MKEKITDYLAWFIAKLVKPVYNNRKKFLTNKNVIILGSLAFVLVLFTTLLGMVNNEKRVITAEKIELNNENQEVNEVSTEQNVVDTKDFSFINIEAIDATMLPVYSIKINGKNKMFLRSKKEAEDVLEELKNIYKSDDENTEIIDIYFEEKVELEKNYKSIVSFNEVKSTEEALKYIIKGTDEEKKHKIQKGENFWVLAEKYKISVSNLTKANPDVVPERLQIGQEISLIVPEPLINVCTVENVVYDEKIQYEVEYEETGSLYKDEFSVKSRGVYGKKQVNAELVKRDGKELGKVILNEKIVSNPVTKVVYKGTKPLPPKKGTGYFSKPLNRGTITSGYGQRYHPVYRIYRKHTGVDIGANYGSKVLASDGGRVIYAGWKTGYGKCVIIDHGANLTSLYAHMSSINVSKGEDVYKGKTVGKVGSTGTSTGNHLHFEIRKNGNDVNPNNYINLYNYY